MKIQIKLTAYKKMFTTLFLLGAINVASVEAKDPEPSVMPSINIKANTNLTIPSKTDPITKRLKINKNNLPKAQGKKPIVKISAPGGGKMLREIDYYKNDEIVIPLYASLAYDSKGNNLRGSSLSWSYVVKNGTEWVTFGKGQSVQLKLPPDSTTLHNNTYKVGIRLTAKDQINGLTNTDVVSLSIQAIAK